MPASEFDSAAPVAERQRRCRWYCCPDCFEYAVTAEFTVLLKLRDEPLSHLHRVPLGLLLLGRGVITNAQLKSALAIQRESRAGRLGRVLVKWDRFRAGCAYGTRRAVGLRRVSG